MMMLEPLLNELRAEGHLTVEVLPPVSAETGVSHWILGLQIIGGWLAAIFLLLFLGMGAAPFIKGASSWMILGLVMTALAGVLLRRINNADGTVLRQFLLVASLAGQGALIVGAGDYGRVSGSAAYAMIALYEVVLLLWVGWMPHRLVAVLVGAGALVVALDQTFSHQLMRYWVGVYWLVVCLLWYSEKRWRLHRQADVLYALASGLSLLCCLGTLAPVLGFYSDFRFLAAPVSVVSIGFALLMARPLLSNARQLFAILLLVAALGVTWKASAIGMGGLLLVFGFAQGRRWLMWLGGAMLVFGVGRFYYDLQLTLLYKSGLMVLGGALLLAVRALIGVQEENP